jgi:cytochrome c-type biogenesis protein CcmH/NrfF
VRTSFVAAYGPSILMTPPHRGVGALAYALPVVVVLVACATGAVLLRRLASGGRPVREPGEEELR